MAALAKIAAVKIAAAMMPAFFLVDPLRIGFSSLVLNDGGRVARQDDLRAIGRRVNCCMNGGRAVWLIDCHRCPWIAPYEQIGFQVAAVLNDRNRGLLCNEPHDRRVVAAELELAE